MKSRIVLFFAVTFLTLGLTSVFAQSNANAPNFILKAADETTLELAKLKGKVVVINFWATWCGPCRKEIPDFLEVYKEQKASGLEIVGISLDHKGWSVVKPFIEREKIDYPIVMGDDAVVKAYGNIEAIPTTFIVDRKGKIVTKHVGYMSKAELEKAIKQPMSSK